MQKSVLTLTLTLTLAPALLACGGTAPPRLPASAPLAVEHRIDVGDRAPAFEGRDLVTGATLRAPADKVTLLWMWATWSGPSNQAMPKVAWLMREHGDRINVVTVSLDDGDAPSVASFARMNGPVPVIWEADRRIAEAYRPANEPTFYVIDRQGIVRYVNNGYQDGTIARLEAECAKWR
jgi:thiol-disulfide isomerase/thioredoxin